MADGRDITVALSAKRVAEALEAVANGEVDGERNARFTTAGGTRVWINPAHVAAIEDLPER